MSTNDLGVVVGGVAGWGGGVVLTDVNGFLSAAVSILTIIFLSVNIVSKVQGSKTKRSPP